MTIAPRKPSSRNCSDVATSNFERTKEPVPMPSAARKTSTARAVAATLRQAGNLADHCCVVVANGLRARFFVVEETAHPRARYRLAERADLTNAESAARGVNAPGVRTERNTNRQLGPM